MRTLLFLARVLCAAVIGLVLLTSASAETIRLVDVDNHTIGGKNASDIQEKSGLEIFASGCDNLTIQNLRLIDPVFKITHFNGLTIKNVQVLRGGRWEILSGPIALTNMENRDRWAGITNYCNALGDDRTSPPGNWRRVWRAGTVQTISIEKSRVFGPLQGYYLNEWLLRDSEGIEHQANLQSAVDLGSIVTFTLWTATSMAPGPGNFMTRDPAKMSRNVVLDNVQVAGMETIAMFYIDGVTVRNSEFSAATKDYNVGFEECTNVLIENVRSWANTKWATIGFVYGGIGVTIKNTESANTRVDTRGWPFKNVKSNVPIIYIDGSTGWYRLIQVDGKDVTPVRKAA